MPTGQHVGVPGGRGDLRGAVTPAEGTWVLERSGVAGPESVGSGGRDRRRESPVWHFCSITGSTADMPPWSACAAARRAARRVGLDLDPRSSSREGLTYVRCGRRRSAEVVEHALELSGRLRAGQCRDTRSRRREGAGVVFPVAAQGVHDELVLGTEDRCGHARFMHSLAQKWPRSCRGRAGPRWRQP